MRKGKIDKGFELFYWNLSYRRKFIRTIWAFLFFIFFIAIIPAKYLIGPNFKKVVWVLTFILFPIQIIYNYFKWKKDNKS